MPQASTPQPDVKTQDVLEDSGTDQADVSLDEVSENENQVSNVDSDDTEASNS